MSLWRREPLSKYPTVADLSKRAKKRIPFFAWEYLDSGTGAERLVDANRQALDAVTLRPSFCHGDFEPSLETELFGHRFSVPFGMAPVGMSGLMWPGAERALAQAAKEHDLPYALSMVACETPETIGGIAKDKSWFQLYPTKDPEISRDLMDRAWAAGMRVLVVTIDVPVGSRRERQLRAGLTVPPRMTPLMLWRVVKRPEWALSTLFYGQPRFWTLERYFEGDAFKSAGDPVARIVGGRPSWTTIGNIRAHWQGTLVVKGIQDPGDADRAIDLGADGIVVSNHGGRQFDGGPPAINLLPPIRDSVGDRCKILFDSGIRRGLDIVRALASGADFCLLGRPFLYGVAALGHSGASHTYQILREDLRNNMIQLGVDSIDAVKAILPEI